MDALSRFVHYRVGNAQIDAEHQHFLEILLPLSNSPSQEECIKALTDLKDAFVLHCAHEVTWMKECNYPCIKFHVEDHNKIEARIKHHQEMASKHFNTKSCMHCLQDIVNVFLEHIDHFDSQVENHRVK